MIAVSLACILGGYGYYKTGEGRGPGMAFLKDEVDRDDDARKRRIMSSGADSRAFEIGQEIAAARAERKADGKLIMTTSAATLLIGACFMFAGTGRRRTTDSGGLAQ